MIKKDNDGLFFESNSGKRYDLLEGVTIGNEKRSDIFFIMYGDDEKSDIVGFLYGASLLNEKDTYNYCELIERMVNEYERKNNENY